MKWPITACTHATTCSHATSTWIRCRATRSHRGRKATAIFIPSPTSTRCASRRGCRRRRSCCATCAMSTRKSSCRSRRAAFCVVKSIAPRNSASPRSAHRSSSCTCLMIHMKASHKRVTSILSRSDASSRITTSCKGQKKSSSLARFVRISSAAAFLSNRRKANGDRDSRRSDCATPICWRWPIAIISTSTRRKRSRGKTEKRSRSWRSGTNATPVPVATFTFRFGTRAASRRSSRANRQHSATFSADGCRTFASCSRSMRRIRRRTNATWRDHSRRPALPGVTTIAPPDFASSAPTNRCASNVAPPAPTRMLISHSRRHLLQDSTASRKASSRRPRLKAMCTRHKNFRTCHAR